MIMKKPNVDFLYMCNRKYWQSGFITLKLRQEVTPGVKNLYKYNIPVSIQFMGACSALKLRNLENVEIHIWDAIWYDTRLTEWQNQSQ